MNGVDRLFDQLPRTFFVVPILLLIVGLVFTFDGAVLWRKARVWAVVLVALAFLVIIIINNQ